MRFAASLIAALAVAGCNSNQPIYSSGPVVWNSSKPADQVAGCISGQFQTRNALVTGADVPGGRAVLVTVDGIVYIRVDVTQAGTGSRVAFNASAFDASTYEPLARGCL